MLLSTKEKAFWRENLNFWFNKVTCIINTVYVLHEWQTQLLENQLKIQRVMMNLIVDRWIRRCHFPAPTWLLLSSNYGKWCWMYGRWWFSFFLTCETCRTVQPCFCPLYLHQVSEQAISKHDMEVRNNVFFHRSGINLFSWRSYVLCYVCNVRYALNEPFG